jgi:diphosphomevalonate decarboxylase
MEKVNSYPKTSGSVTWQSPSNIALIKYWGKKGFQLPANPSLSITLSESFTETTVNFSAVEKGMTPQLEFLFEGKTNNAFKVKIQKYLDTIRDEMPFLNHYDLIINSKNTFPHSAGIASSASAMSALALCLCSIEAQLNGSAENTDVFYQRASHFARIGSGSAARSVYGGFSLWGENELVPGSSDQFAVPLKMAIHSVFDNFRDIILIVSSGEKSVSSRAGHALMEGNPFSEARYRQAGNNLAKLLSTIETGDLDSFIAITENEALTLHGMMMASTPGYTLMEPNTLEILKRVKDFREQTGAKLCFTLDAGPNVHLLFSAQDAGIVDQFIKSELQKFCANNQLIEDKIGSGPQKIF